MYNITMVIDHFTLIATSNDGRLWRVRFHNNDSALVRGHSGPGVIDTSDELAARIGTIFQAFNVNYDSTEISL